MKITDVKVEAWDIPLKNNMFIMFPSTNMYYLTNNQKDSLNFRTNNNVMNISNYYWYFTGVLTPKFCDDVIAYAKSTRRSYG